MPKLSVRPEVDVDFGLGPPVFTGKVCFDGTDCRMSLLAARVLRTCSHLVRVRSCERIISTGYQGRCKRSVDRVDFYINSRDRGRNSGASLLGVVVKATGFLSAGSWGSSFHSM